MDLRSLDGPLATVVIEVVVVTKKVSDIQNSVIRLWQTISYGKSNSDKREQLIKFITNQ